MLHGNIAILVQLNAAIQGRIYGGCGGVTPPSESKKSVSERQKVGLESSSADLRNSGLDTDSI